MNYPSDWDKTNDFAIRIYERCKSKYKEDEEEKYSKLYKPSIFFHLICISFIIYIAVSLVFVIIKRDAYKKMKSNITFLVLFSIGSLLNICNFYFKRVIIIIFLKVVLIIILVYLLLIYINIIYKR